MRRATAFFTLVIFVGCNAATAPSPSPDAAKAPPPSPTSTVCPSLAIVDAYVAAAARFDGAAGVASFAPDGTIESPVLTRGPSGLGQPTGVNKATGTDQIRDSITNAGRAWREVQITQSPQGCDAVVTWSVRLLPVNIGAPVDLSATATLRDGKIASVVYLEASR